MSSLSSFVSLLHPLGEICCIWCNDSFLTNIIKYFNYGQTENSSSQRLCQNELQKNTQTLTSGPNAGKIAVALALKQEDYQFAASILSLSVWSLCSSCLRGFKLQVLLFPPQSKHMLIGYLHIWSMTLRLKRWKIKIPNLSKMVHV